MRMCQHLTNKCFQLGTEGFLTKGTVIITADKSRPTSAAHLDY